MWHFDPFKRKLTKPFGPSIDAMREKDERLYMEIRQMPVLEAVKAWREVYPEDFADVADR